MGLCHSSSNARGASSRHPDPAAPTASTSSLPPTSSLTKKEGAAPHSQSHSLAQLPPPPIIPIANQQGQSSSTTAGGLARVADDYIETHFKIIQTLSESVQQDGPSLLFEARPLAGLTAASFPPVVYLKGTRHDPTAKDAPHLDMLCERRLVCTRSLVHPHLIALYDMFVTPDAVVWEVLDPFSATTLHAFVEQHHPLPEATARAFARQLLDVVSFLHSHGLALRTLTTAGIGVAADGTQLQLTDLSFVKSFATDKLSTVCGSPFFVAPEILISDSPYTQLVDLWSLGVIFFYLLSGALPFASDNLAAVLKRISAAQFDYQLPIWSTRSPAPRDLISHMLVLDPTQRWDTTRCRAHEWFQLDS